MAALPENDRIAGPFLATAGQTDFPADFPLIDAAGVRVRRERAGAVTVLTGADVAVVSPTADGFTVRIAASQAGDRVFVYSDLPPVRPRTHPANGATRSETLEGDAVGAQAQLQEHYRDLKRAVLARPGETGVELPAVTARAGTVAVWDDAGTAMRTDRTLDDFDADVAASAANAAATATALAAATAQAQAAAEALAAVLETASGAPDAPSILNKANRDGSNLSDDDRVDFRAALGVSNRTSEGLRPAFIFPERGLFYTTPANLRTAVPEALRDLVFAEGGGFVHEMAVPVVGTKGSKVLTTAASDLVAGFGADPWSAALNAVDGSQDIFVEVMGHDGAGEIYLNEPLPFDFTGTLCSRWDQAGGAGIHMTQGATRAYAQVVGEAVVATSARGGILCGTHHRLPPSANRLWERNAALVAYGVSNSAAPIVQTSLQIDSPDNIVGAGSVPTRPMSAACGIIVGTHAAGHGAVAVLDLNRRSVVIEWWSSAKRSTQALSGVEIAVTATTDTGAVIYEAVASHVARRHRVVVSGVDRLTLSEVNQDGQTYYLGAFELTVRELGDGGRVIRSGQLGVLHTDSWGAYYAGLLGKVLAEKTGATIINHSRSGMTTEYHLAWHGPHVADLKPDFVVRTPVLNDYSYAVGAAMQQFEDPDGNMVDLWPAEAVGEAEGKAHWLNNAHKLIALDAAVGAQTAWVSIGGVASIGTAQTLMGWWAALDAAAPTLDYVAAPAELTDPTSLVNTAGKFTGRPLISNGRTLFAQGAEPGDDWRNPAEEGAKDALLLSLDLADYNATNSIVIGTDALGTGGNTAGDGVSDGVFVNEYGSRTGDSYAFSIVAGRQRLASTYATSDGNRRLQYDFSVESGVEYIIAARVVNATPSMIMDAMTTLTAAGGVVINETNGNRTVDADGNATIWLRGTADATATRALYLGNGRSDGASRTHDVEKVVCVRAGELLADVPSQSGLTSAELADFVLRLK